jgi:hypothetical protein
MKKLITTALATGVAMMSSLAFATGFEPTVVVKACGTQNEILLPNIASNAAQSGITLHSDKGFAGYDITCNGKAGEKLSTHQALNVTPVELNMPNSYSLSSNNPQPNDTVTFTANGMLPSSATSMLTFSFPDECFGPNNQVTTLTCNITRTMVH